MARRSLRRRLPPVISYIKEPRIVEEAVFFSRDTELIVEDNMFDIPEIEPVDEPIEKKYISLTKLEDWLNHTIGRLDRFANRIIDRIFDR